MAYKQNNPTSTSTYSMIMQTNSSNPADATVYYMVRGTAWVTNNDNSSRFYIPLSGTLNVVNGSINVRGTLGSAQNTTLDIIKNNTTVYTVSSTISTGSVLNNFSASSLGISVSPGDYLAFRITTPTWTTNPTTVSFSATAVIG